MNKRFVIDSKVLTRFACLLAAIIACNDITKIKIGNGLFGYFCYIVLVAVCVLVLLIKLRIPKGLTVLLWGLFYFVILISSVRFRLLFSGVHIRILAIIVFLITLCLDDFDQMKMGIYLIIGYALFQAAGIYLQLLLPEVHKALFSFITIFFNLQEGGTTYERLSDFGYFRGFCVNPGFTAIYIVNGIACLGVFKETLKKYEYILLNGILILALILTGKRGQLLAFIIGFIVVYIVCSNNLEANVRHVFIAAAIIGLLYAAGFYLYLHHPNIPGLSRTLDLVYGSNSDLYTLTSGRTNLWDSAMTLYRGNELLGIGWNQYLHIRGMLPHNTYLQVLCELGSVGFIFFIASLAGTLVCTIQSYFNNAKKDCSEMRKPVLRAFIFFQVYFIVYSISGNTLWDAPIYYMYFIFLTLSNMYIVKKRYRFKL